MLILKYFVTVGAFLTIGLFALSAYLEPTSTPTGAHVAVTPTTASLLYVEPAPGRSK